MLSFKSVQLFLNSCNSKISRKLISYTENYTWMSWSSVGLRRELWGFCGSPSTKYLSEESNVEFVVAWFWLTYTTLNWSPLPLMTELLSLKWHHNECDVVSNHMSFHCFLICWFRRRSKKTSKLRVTGLCAGKSPVTGEIPAQKASNAKNASIWWRHHENSDSFNLKVV